jgi:hypothetical protein
MDFNEVLELKAPHGFLITQGKKTAVARIEPLDIEQSHLIVSNGEAYGVAEFEQPAQIKTKDFDSEEWSNQHRVTGRERRQWWPDVESFYVYRLKSWQPFEGIKLYEDGQVIDEPRLTSEQWKIVSKAKELPKQIIVQEDFIHLTCDYNALCGDKSFYNRELKQVIDATFDRPIECNDLSNDDEIIPIYSLALVRNPRMRVSKKSPETAEIKQEGETMPFEIRRREDEYCVIKINPDESEETMACHETEEEAEAQLVALRINVEAEEGESSLSKNISVDFSGEDVTYTTVPGLDKIISTGKSEPNFMQRLKLAAKNILDIVTLAEKEEDKQDILTSNYGVTQKRIGGELWHFTWSTNAFEDREGEIFSTKSLENYVLQAAERQEKGYFNLWHINAEDGNFNTDFAKKEWQGVVGRFLVEAGPYLDDKKGQAAKKFFSEFSAGHPEIAPEGWGCSPEFRYLPEERATGIYKNIWITRTSTLPKFAAANVWTDTRQLTRSKNMALSDDQIKAAVEVFQDEDFVKSLIAEGESKTAELEAQGVAHKGENEKPETEQVEPQKIDMEELAAEVGKQFGANLEPIAEAIADLVMDIKELKEWREKQDKAQDVKDRTETPRYVFEWKRASEDKETIVTEDDGLKDKKPAETQGGNNDPWSQVFNK